MNFYTINYIQSHQDTDRTALYILMIVAASLMVIFAILYLRDRFNTRYRDLGIIALLFLLLFTGTQYEKYVQNNEQKSKAAQIIPFIKSIANDEKVKESDVMVSSTTLQDGMIVRIDSKNEDYQLNLNEDNNSYTLKRAHVIDHHVYVQK